MIPDRVKEYTFLPRSIPLITNRGTLLYRPGGSKEKRKWQRVQSSGSTKRRVSASSLRMTAVRTSLSITRRSQETDSGRCRTVRLLNTRRHRAGKVSKRQRYGPADASQTTLNSKASRGGGAFLVRFSGSSLRCCIFWFVAAANSLRVTAICAVCVLCPCRGAHDLPLTEKGRI